jgi:acetyl esterase/lipase
VALKAKKEGKLEQVDGVYAFCPYICGMWRDPDCPEALALESVEQNDKLFVTIDDMTRMASLYLPEGVSPKDEPLAWPLWAPPADMQGLPPHVISVNELDPLRDEGIAYYRKLMAAGVTARAKVVMGTPHAADLCFMKFAPSLFEASITDLALFVNSL